jgi:hypothetical protein
MWTILQQMLKQNQRLQQSLWHKQDLASSSSSGLQGQDSRQGAMRGCSGWASPLLQQQL